MHRPDDNLQIVRAAGHNEDHLGVDATLFPKHVN